MLKKVISGGQNGVDQAALVAAKAVKLQTGGWAPRGWHTLDGPKPSLGKVYGLKEHESDQYPPRTRQNVLDSDGTLRIAIDFTTAGERCTEYAILKYGKPWVDIRLEWITPRLTEEMHARVQRWILEHQIQCLNVAGNSEFTCPGIFDRTLQFLADLFDLCKSKS